MKVVIIACQKCGRHLHIETDEESPSTGIYVETMWANESLCPRCNGTIKKDDGEEVTE